MSVNKKNYNFPSLRKGPRGAPIPSGRCICDDPTLDTVKDVRVFAKENGTCDSCGDRGLKLVQFGLQVLHVRCLLRLYGFEALAQVETKYVRLCCVGGRVMKRLLWRTTDDGHRHGGKL